MKITGFLVKSDADLFKSGLHGWVYDIERAFRFPTVEDARKHLELYSAEQRAQLEIIEECDFGDCLAHRAVEELA